jgi:hypothetical protein
MRTNLSAEPPKCRESIVFNDAEVKLIYLEDEADDEVSLFFAHSNMSFPSQVSPKSSKILLTEVQ